MNRRGQGVDRRTDVRAFACVLFEMLTGRRTFDGSSVVDAIGAASAQGTRVAPAAQDDASAVRATLERCLQKDPRQRARDLGDVRLALDGGSVHRQVDALVLLPSSPRWWPMALAILATAVIFGAARLVRSSSTRDAGADAGAVSDPGTRGD